MTTDTPMTDAQYRTSEGVNFTTAKIMHPSKGSPRHYRHALDNPDDGDTASRGMLRGTHCMCLTPDLFDRDFVVYEGRRDKRMAVYKDFLAEHEGKTIINPKEHETLTATATAVRNDPVARTILTHPGAMFETPMWWVDPRTGMNCKGRADIIVVFRDDSGAIVRVLVADLKTVQSTDARQMLRDIGKMLYHVQLDHYGDGVCALLGVDQSMIDYAIVAAEGTAPHDVAVHYIDPELMHTGSILRGRMLKRIAECTETGVWPGRYPAAHMLEAPEYMLETPTDDELAEILEQAQAADADANKSGE